MNSARSVNLNLVAWAWFLWLLALAAMAGVFVVPDVGLGLRGVFSSLCRIGCNRWHCAMEAQALDGCRIRRLGSPRAAERFNI